MVGTVFDREHEPVVVDAEGGGAGEHAHAREGVELRAGGRRPDRARLTVNRFGVVEQGPSDGHIIVDQDDAGPGPRGDERRAQPGGSRPDHEHLGVRVPGVVAPRIGFGRQTPLAGEAAGGEPGGELNGGGEQHRFGEWCFHLHECTGFLASGRHDAAGTPEAHTAAETADSGSEEGRGEGVAGESAVVDTAEGERDGGVAVDGSAGG